MSEKIISIYNPKHPNFVDISCKPDPKEVYGGILNYEASLSHGGVNPKSLGHFDDDGNYIRINPKDIGLKKNKEAKAKVTSYLNIDEFDEFEGIICESSDKDEIYFAEYGVDEIKKAYKWVNEDNEEVVNPRWKRFLKKTGGEE